MIHNNSQKSWCNNRVPLILKVSQLQDLLIHASDHHVAMTMERVRTNYKDISNGHNEKSQQSFRFPTKVIFEEKNQQIRTRLPVTKQFSTDACAVDE